MTLTLFIGLWLAAHRVTRFVLDDSITDSLRIQLYLRFPPDDAFRSMHRVTLPNGKREWQPVGPARPISKIGEFFYCYWCLGFWVSGAVVLAVMQFVSIPLPLLWWPAVSSAVALTARNLDGE